MYYKITYEVELQKRTQEINDILFSTEDLNTIKQMGNFKNVSIFRNEHESKKDLDRATNLIFTHLQQAGHLTAYPSFGNKEEYYKFFHNQDYSSFLGPDATIPFKVREIPNWTFCIWWSYNCSSSSSWYLEGTIFGEYDALITKFKPTYCHYNTTIKVFPSGQDDLFLGSTEIENMFLFIKNNSWKAWYETSLYDIKGSCLTRWFKYKKQERLLHKKKKFINFAYRKLKNFVNSFECYKLHLMECTSAGFEEVCYYFTYRGEVPKGLPYKGWCDLKNFDEEASVRLEQLISKLVRKGIFKYQVYLLIYDQVYILPPSI